MGFLNKFFGTYSERELKRIKPQVQAVLALEEEYSRLSEEDLKGRTALFRERLAAGEAMDDLLPEAFAAVREAAWRVLGMKHFPVQVEGGIVLHQGRIAEMKTGEGKTLVATLPVYLNALTGEGVHVVTVNDYLAKRDSEWMGKIYRYLGLSVGLVVHGMSNADKRAAYKSDLLYGTNNELGFDYLRDNMVHSIEDRMQRELSFAIVDEVDSILVDEARTPLIISGQGSESSDMYGKADQIARSLKMKRIVETGPVRTDEEMVQIYGDSDYVVDEKAKSATLTPRGVAKVERFFGIENLSDEQNHEINHHINNALKAYGTMFRDQDYVVKDGEVIIVDDFTGRLMQGRRYSNGLHQAIEAKEGVKIEKENQTLATITFQNFFRMYRKLSGMTGTALTEEDEFREIYKLDVVTIPTNMPMIRDDQPDAVYKTQRGKFAAIVSEVARAHEKGQPVLVGTVSVETSELLSQLFTQSGIRHNVLNAKHHEREAEIVAQAGRLGAVTIATNMAGRGTDIILGGNPEFLAKQEMRKRGYDEELVEQSTALNETDDEAILEARHTFAALKQSFEASILDERKAVLEAGGLYIVGTERHESRRIDNQLRGRAGRQGDPGKSRFYLSLEDDLMRLFGGDRIDRMFSAIGVQEDMEIEHAMLSRAIETAQKRVEARNFSIRKHVLEYDDVMNQQRNLIYAQRKEVLEGRDLHEYYQRMITEQMEETLLDFIAGEPDVNKWDMVALDARIRDIFGPLKGLSVLKNPPPDLDGSTLNEMLAKEALAALEARAEELGSDEMLRAAERFILLQTVDRHWMEQIDAMDELRDSIGMRGYAQKDPVIEYKREGLAMFEGMTAEIKENVVRLILRARLVNAPKRPQSGPKNIRTGRGSEGFTGEAAAPAAAEKPANVPARRGATPGRNDPCWCGSGKKYKACHLRSDEEGTS
ncbi:MAG TPA: preprotein translocase subunit SecA [Clostridiaceae bacterium]|nr:preprotein translocase subunit SecA [Clostridiaceae bacterium]